MENNNHITFKEIIRKYRVLLTKSKDNVGQIAVELFNESFEKQGQIMGNGSVKKWEGRGFSNPSRKGRFLLMQRGTLRRSIEYKKRANSVEIRSDTPYSLIQNDGGVIKVTAKMRRFFWAMYFKHAYRVVYNIADRSIKQTKANIKRNDEAEFWLKMAMAKQITIPSRPFIYETPELPNRLDKFFIKAISNIVK